MLATEDEGEEVKDEGSMCLLISSLFEFVLLIMISYSFSSYHRLTEAMSIG